MGNHHSHEPKEGEGAPSRSRTGSRRLSTPRGSGSGPALEKPAKPPPPPSMVPVEKLAKMLAQRSLKEDGVNGITEKSFTQYVFPRYPELSRRFFRHVARAAGSPGAACVSAAAFRAHTEQVLALLEDNLILDTYVRMFGCEEEAMVTVVGFRALVLVCLQLALDYCAEGPRRCPLAQRTLDAVARGCFGAQQAHSAGFVARWLHDHCRRLLLPLHRYCVHVLATKHRELELELDGAGGPREDEAAGLGLSSPVLDGGAGGAGGSQLLPVSAACLLAAAAPPLYSRPLLPAPPAPPASHNAGGAGALSSRAWLSRLVSAAPLHWAPLYCSRDHGRGANRFMHHTFNYRGPTIVVVSGGDAVVAVLAPQEWRETHQYWGSADCALVQMQPHWSVVETGPKMLYLNESIRGYPKGLRAGSDPRAPLLAVDDGFDTFTFNGVPYTLDSIEVWGCGDAASRDNQLEVKKWQMKEAERHREVKLSPAEWMEHPDRYLLELAGRPQYNTSGS